MINMWERLNLFLFDGEGGAAAGGGDGGEGEAAVVEPADDAPVPRKRAGQVNKLAGVQYGTPAEDPAPQAEATTEQAQQAPDPAEEWNELRNGKYKAQFDADVQNIVRDRLKGRADAEATLQKLGPMLEALATKYGVEAGDLDGLSARITDDDSLYEDEALERGMPVETLKQLKQLERDNAAYRAQQEQDQQQQFFQAHIQKLMGQFEQVRNLFPNADLRAELQNEQFRRLTSPEVGVDAMTAYRVVHAAEIEPAAMNVASQRTAQAISNKIQAQGRRPAENGVQRTAAVDVRSDPSKLKLADFEEIKRRVQRGEKVRF